MTGINRILLTCHHSNLSQNQGVSAVVLNLYDRLLENSGNNIELVSHDNLWIKSARWRRIIFPLFVAYRVVSRQILGKPYSIIWSTSGDVGILGLIGLAFRNTRIVFHSHGIEQLVEKNLAEAEDVKKGIRNILHKMYEYRLIDGSLKVASHALVYTNTELEYCRAVNSKLRVKIIDNFSRFDVANASLDKVPQSIAFIGSGTYRKGFDTLLTLIPEAIGCFPDIKFVLLGIGKTDFEDAISTLCANFGDRIVVVRNFENYELVELLGEIDIYLSLSRAEGFPLVLLEAMSMGLIPVVSNLEVNRRICQEVPLIIAQNESTTAYIEALQKAQEISIVERRRFITWAANHHRDTIIDSWISFVISGV